MCIYKTSTFSLNNIWLVNGDGMIKMNNIRCYLSGSRCHEKKKMLWLDYEKTDFDIDDILKV